MDSISPHQRAKRVKRIEPEAMRLQRIESAMFSLITNTEFQAFIELIDDLREEAYAYAISDAYVKDDRLSLKTLGESCAYNNIVAKYDEYRNRLEQRIQEQQAEAVDGG